MNLLKRAQTVTAGAVLGLVGVATFAAPALACKPVITPVSSCVNPDESWTVTWALASSDRGLQGDVTSVETTPGSTVTGIVAGAVIPANDTLTGVQTLPATAESASIKVTAHWVVYGRDATNTRTGYAPKPRRACRTDNTPPPTKPTPTPTKTSQGNPPPPPKTTSPTPTPSKTASTTPAEPQFIYDATCDKLTVGVEVPADWPQPVTVTFKPNTGEAKTVTAKPGETKTVEFPASAGLKVTATPKGAEDEAATIAYKEPADCDNSGSGGGLPLTGAASGTIAGGAAALLAIGAVLFVLARRRKVKFTA